jgi:hypothetical protein
MLSKVGLRAHPDKSVFGVETIGYLGHNVSASGLTPHGSKILAIMALPSPKSVKQLQEVLGFIGYYRCYIVNY